MISKDQFNKFFKKHNNSKNNLFIKLIFVYILLLVFSTILYFLIRFLLSSEIIGLDTTLISNLLIWSATIFTPISAFLLYDTWKEQKQYDLEKEQLSICLNNLSIIYGNLKNIEEKYEYIKNTKNFFCYDPNILLENRDNRINEIYLDFSSSFNMYLKLRGENIGDFDLHNFKSNLILSYDIYYGKIFKLYAEYVKVIEQNFYCKTKGIREERQYDHSARAPNDNYINDYFALDTIVNEIEQELLIERKYNFIKGNLLPDVFEYKQSDNEIINNFPSILNRSIISTNSLISFCIERIKLKN